ncbi:MAG: Extracellular serine protease [Verrucomicrobiaceae bacterium]|nr:Extracellular serine protease [Verrucomicrobiaceae bacterium]
MLVTPISPGFSAISRLKLVFACLLLSLFSTFAAGQAVWDGGGTTNNWSDTVNWGATVPADGGTQALQFAGTTKLAPVNDFATFTATSLTFNSGAGAFSLSGNAINLTGDVVNNSSNAQTIALGLNLDATHTFNSGTTSLTINGNITGATAGITKTGAGTLVLGGSNSFGGLVTVSTGFLQATSSTAFGDAATGVTVTAGARVELANVNIASEPITINGTTADNFGSLRAISGTGTWGGTITLGSGTGAGGTRVGTTGASTLVMAGAIVDNGSGFDLAVRTDGNTSGKVVISNSANSYRDTYIVVGTVQIDSGNDRLPTTRVLNVGNASNVSFATFDLNGWNQTVGGVAMQGGDTTMTNTITNSNATTASTFTINNSSANTFGGTITGNLSLTKTGAGDLALTAGGAAGNATNTYTGLTSINQGSITISKNTGLGNTGSGAAASGTVVASGAALLLQNSITVGAEALSLSGSGISSNGALRNVSGTNTWGGAITLLANAEIQADAGSLTLDVTTGSAITGTFNLTVDTFSTSSITVADPITTGTGTLTKTGIGTLTFTGAANTYTGNTLINGGTLILSKAAGVDAIAGNITIGDNSGALDILRLGNSSQINDNSILTFNGNGSGSTAGVFQLNGKSETVAGIISGATSSGLIENEGGVAATLTVNNSTTQTFSGIIRDGDGTGTDGSLALVKNGASGTLTLKGANSYSGLTTVTAGVLQVQHATGLGTGDGTMTTGTTVANGARVEISGGITIANEAITIVGNGGNPDSSGALRGTGSGTNTWGGPLIIGSAPGVAPSTGAPRIGARDGSTLVISGTISDSSNGWDLAIRTDGAAGSKVVISGTGNSYRDTYIVVGLLAIDSGDDRLPVASVVSVGNSSDAATATFDLNGFNQRSGGLTSLGTTMTRTVTNTGATTSTLTIDAAAANSYAGVITGALNLAKAGTATQTLSGVNIYTGKTSIQGGTLALSGSGSIDSTNWIDISQGASLSVSGRTGGSYTFAPATGTKVISGSGTVTGNLTVGGVAYLSPGTTSDPADIAKAGDGAGTLSVSGNLIFNPSAASTVAMLNILSSSQADQLVIGGGLTLNSNSNIIVTFAPAFSPAPGNSWNLLDWSGLLTAGGFSTGTNFRTGNNADNNEGNLDLPFLDGGFTWQISNFTGSGSLTVSITPEPSRVLLLCLGFAGLLWRRRR